MASRSKETLVESIAASLRALMASGTRNFVLVLDETVWSPCWDVVCDLREGAPFGYIGGYHPDHSFIPATDVKKLPNEYLSKLCMHYVVSRADSSKAVYCFDALPRATAKAEEKKRNSAEKVMGEISFAFQAATDANGGLPPIAASFDGAGSNVLINATLLGLLGTDKMKEFPFWDKASKKDLGLPCWAYKGVFWKSFWIGGNNDSRHALKRYTTHLTSGIRAIKFGDVLCSLTAMVKTGLPIRALSADDLQSDKESYLGIS